MKRNYGISSIAAVVVVLVILILTSGAVAISFDAISVGQHTSTLTLTVVNTTIASVVCSLMRSNEIRLPLSHCALRTMP